MYARRLNRGLSAEFLAENVAINGRKSHRHEVSSKKQALAENTTGNTNWFTVEEFVIRVTVP